MHHAAHTLVSARPTDRSRPATASRPTQAWAWLGALGLMLVLHSSPLRAKDTPTAAPAAKTSASASAAPTPAVAPAVAPGPRVTPAAAPASSGTPASASPPAADKKQTTRMSECSAQFKTTGRPGSERKAFMQVCLRKPKP